MKQQITRRVLRLSPALLTIGLLATAAPSFAQRGDDGGRGMNGQGGMNGGGQNGNRGDRTQMQTQMITRSLKSAGFTDQKLIDDVTTYVTKRRTARQPLFDAADALSMALRDENATDVRIATLWTSFQAALATEKTRNAAAEVELDKEVGFGKDPAMAAALTLLGVTGDARSYLDAGQGRGGAGRPGGQNGPEGQGGPNGGPGPGGDD